MHTARALIDRHAKLRARLAKLHVDATRALAARKGSPEDLVRVHVIAQLTEGEHLRQLHGNGRGK